MDLRVGQAYQQLAKRFTALGLRSEAYTIQSFAGYAPVTDQATDVYCVEAHLGPAPSKPGYDSYAVVQGFDPRYPSLALVFLIELHRDTREPSPVPPIYSIPIDDKFSGVFLPTMHTALNDLDPTGRARGLLLQSYHATMVFKDFFPALLNSQKLTMRFKRDGQLAQVAVDFDDPLIRFIATLFRPVMRLVGDMYSVPRTKQLSSIRIPIREPRSGYHLVSNSSTALDEGFQIARGILDAHYKAAGYTPHEQLAAGSTATG